jgi:HAD superfamily phosphoserine phosphatase-like hydrolase
VKSDRRWRMGGFDLDGTLITGSTVLLHIGRHLNRSSDVERLVEGYENFRLSNYEVTEEAAKMFAGLTQVDLLNLMEDIPRLEDIGEVVSFLKRRGIRAVVATVSFAFAAEWFARRYLFDDYSGILLEFDEKQRATGRVSRHVSEEDKAAFVLRESARFGFAPTEVFYVGDSRSDIPTFKVVGCAIALNASREAKGAASASIETQSLREALTLVPGLL